MERETVNVNIIRTDALRRKFDKGPGAVGGQQTYSRQLKVEVYSSVLSGYQPWSKGKGERQSWELITSAK